MGIADNTILQQRNSLKICTKTKIVNKPSLTFLNEKRKKLSAKTIKKESDRLNKSS